MEYKSTTSRQKATKGGNVAFEHHIEGYAKGGSKDGRSKIKEEH